MPKVAVTKEIIERTASLARLRLTPAEAEAMAETLNKVFQYIDQLARGRYHGRGAAASRAGDDKCDVP